MKRAILYFCLAVLLAVCTWLIHIWITTPLQMSRWLFPLEAIPAKLSTTCSEKAPAWLEQSAQKLPGNSRSLANQFAYLDGNGDIHTCRNGWMHGVLQGKRVSDQSLFQIASVTKFFTATLIVEAHLQARISVDRLVSDVLPTLGSPVRAMPDNEIAWNKMQVADLLRHSAGFDRMPNGDPMLLQNRTPPCPYALPEVRSYVLDFKPGTRYGYGNINYCLLGVLAENVYGVPYRKLVQQRFVREGKGEFSDGPYSEEEPRYDIRFENQFSENFWKSYDFSALSAAAGMRISAIELINIVKAERAHLKEYLAFANRYILPDVDCGKFMKCYSLMGSYYSANGRYANVWRGNMIGTAAMLIIMDDGSALAWLGGGQSPTQYRDDEKMFSFWFENMAHTHSSLPTRQGRSIS